MKPFKEIRLSSPKKGSKISFNLALMLKEIGDFKGWEYIFQVLFYGFIAWGVHSMYLIYRFHHEPYYSEVKKFQLKDFQYSLIPALFFFVYKRISIKLYYKWMLNTLDHTKFATEEERHLRATRGAVWLSHIIYYSFTTILSYVLFNDTFFYPKYLGGSAQCSAIYEKTPYVPHIPYAVAFYQMQFGWHLHTLIDHVVYKWKEPKFWEMFLHHSMAVFLIFFSYLCNQVPVGILVLVLHDPCDIGLYLVRLLNDRKNSNFVFNIMCYIMFVASWMYFRLFVFPKCIVGQGFESFFDYPVDMMYTVYLHLLVMMSALVVLHLYWFVFVMRITVEVLQGKADPNLYDKSRKSN